MYAIQSSIPNYQQKIVCIDQLVPQDNIYRKINEIIDWDYVRSFFDGFYSQSGRGRKGYDPVVFVKIFLIQYIEGFKSVRQTIEKIKVDIALRWFLGIGFEDNIPNHSTLSHQYLSNFRNSNVFDRVFNYILEVAFSYDLVDPSVVFVDATHVKANANPHKYTAAYVKEEVGSLQKMLDEELLDSINEDRKAHNKKPLKQKELEPVYSDQVVFKIEEIKDKASKMEPKELADFSEELDVEKKKNPVLREALNWITLSFSASNKDHCNIYYPQIVLNGQLIQLDLAHKPVNLNDYSIKKVSRTDPESGWFHKGEHKHLFAYSCQVACDRNNIILSYQPFAGNEHDSRTFLKWKRLYDFPIEDLVADAAYKTPKIVHLLFEKGITPILPYKKPMTKKGFFKKYEFVYDEYNDIFICPEIEDLTYKTTDRVGYREYISDPQICSNCPSLQKCTHSQDHLKLITQHVWFEEMERVEDIRYDLTLRELYPKRKETVERVFADAKENHHFRYTNYRGIDRMNFTCSMAFSAANLVKIVRMLDLED